MNEKILIIGPSWLGDMIMAQSLFRFIKQIKPQAVIDVLAPEWSLSVLQRMPEINEGICLPIAHGEFGLKKRYVLAKNLRHKNYSQAIVLTNSWKSALIPWLAKIPQRTGWLGELRWGLLNDVHYLNKKRLPKMVQRYVALAAKELPTELPVPKLAHMPMEKPIAPVLALCPGAAYGPAKRWPENHFAELAKQKINEGWDVWFFGSKQDEEVIEDIRKAIAKPTVSYAGKIDIMQTIDLFAVVSAVVTNDSGLMHLAASLDKPLIAIYGSTSPKFTSPLGSKAKIVQHKIKCSPCFKRECPLGHFECMRKILPADVNAALQGLEV